MLLPASLLPQAMRNLLAESADAVMVLPHEVQIRRKVPRKEVGGFDGGKN